MSPDYSMGYYNDAMYKVTPILEQAGVTIYHPTDAEMKPWRDAVMPIWSQWEKDMNAKGLPGTAVIKDLKFELANRFGRIIE